MNSSEMKIAIMQPYFFPYIGYFQLIDAVDKLVFYDDVNWINKGWINRNNYLVNNEKRLFTIPCKKVSQNKLIKDIYVDLKSKELKNFKTNIYQAYRKAPYFFEIMDIIEKVLNNLQAEVSISTLAIESIKKTCEYLGVSVLFDLSSKAYSSTQGLEKADRLIEITKQNNTKNYINLIGGKDLYKQDYFQKKGVELSFIQSKEIVYTQFSNKFTPWLSIIDVLMFNSIEECKKLIASYKTE